MDVGGWLRNLGLGQYEARGDPSIELLKKGALDADVDRLAVDPRSSDSAPVIPSDSDETTNRQEDRRPRNRGCSIAERRDRLA